MPPITKTICIDFDAVIADYEEWKGPDIFGDLIPGAITYIKRLKNDGWKIIIFTTRGEIYKLQKYLKFYEIPYDDINRNTENPIGANYGKPFAHVYLDDRALQFTGDWEKSYQEIINFKPYYKKGNDNVL